MTSEQMTKENETLYHSQPRMRTAACKTRTTCRATSPTPSANTAKKRLSITSRIRTATTSSDPTGLQTSRVLHAKCFSTCECEHRNTPGKAGNRATPNTNKRETAAKQRKGAFRIVGCCPPFFVGGCGLFSFDATFTDVARGGLQPASALTQILCITSRFETTLKMLTCCNLHL